MGLASGRWAWASALQSPSWSEEVALGGSQRPLAPPTFNRLFFFSPKEVGIASRAVWLVFETLVLIPA